MKKSFWKLGSLILALVLLVNFIFPQGLLGQEFFDDNPNDFNTYFAEEDDFNFDDTFYLGTKDELSDFPVEDDFDFENDPTFENEAFFPETDVDVFPTNAWVDWSDLTALDGGDMSDVSEGAQPASLLLPVSAFQNYDAIFSNQKCLDFYAEYCNSYTKDNPDKTTFRNNLSTWKNSVSEFSLDSTGGATTKYTPSEKSYHLEEIYTVCSNLNTLGQKEPETYDNLFKQNLTKQNLECLSVFGFPVPMSIEKEENLKQELVVAQAFVQSNTSCDLSMAGYGKTVGERFTNTITSKDWSWGGLATIGKWFTNAMLAAGEVILTAVMAIVDALFMTIAAGLVSLSTWLGTEVPRFINPNEFFMSLSGIAGYTVNNELVVYVWTLLRNLSNVFIVFALLYIAIMIMFKKSEYTNFLSLIYLVVIALLINFTLVLCGIAIDISNFLTSIFLSHGGISQLGEAYNVMLHTLYTGSCTAMDASYIKILAPSLLTIIVALILITLMVGLFIMLVLRMLMLWFYAAISPAAAVSYILPSTRSYFDKWSKGFMTQLTSLPILAGAMTLVNLLTLYIVNVMTVSLQQGVENKGTIILFTVVVVVALNGYLLTLFSNLQKGTLTAAVLSKIKFPTSAKELFSNIGKVSAGAALGASGAALASGKGRAFVNKLTSFKRNQSIFTKFGKPGQKLAGLSANFTNAMGDKLQGVISGRDAKAKEPIQNLDSGKAFERYLNRMAFKPGLQKGEIVALVDKANELIKSNDLGIEAEEQVAGILERMDKDYVDGDHKLKKAKKKFEKGAIASYSKELFKAKDAKGNEAGIDAFIEKLGGMGTDDFSKLNFKAIDGLLGDNYDLFSKRLLEKGLKNGGIAQLLLDWSKAGDKGEEQVLKILTAADKNNPSAQMKVISEGLKKRIYNSEDYDKHMERGIDTLNRYRKEFSAGSNERKQLDDIFTKVLDSHNKKNRKQAWDQFVKFLQTYEVKNPYNSRAYLSVNKAWGGVLKNNPNVKKRIDSMFIQEAPGTYKLDNKNKAANLAATFGNLITGDRFDQNDENMFNPMINSVFDNPNVKNNKFDTAIGNFSKITTFYNKHLKAGSPLQMKSDKMRQKYSMLAAIMLLNSGNFTSASTEQKRMLNDLLKESFRYDNAIPLANLFSGLSAIDEKDSYAGEFLRTFANNNSQTINFKDKFEKAKAEVKKTGIQTGKNNKGKDLKVSYNIKNIFKL